MPKRKAPSSSQSKKAKTKNANTNNVAATASAVNGMDPASHLEKPDPVPNPPPPLLKLLQNNSKALKYFQLLQQNLDYDVQKWKLRARKYQKDYQHLLAETSQIGEKLQQQQQQQQKGKHEGEEYEIHGKKTSSRSQGDSDGGNGGDAGNKDISDDDQMKMPLPKKKHHQVSSTPKETRYQKEIPIDDTMFDFSSSSDGDDEDENGREERMGDLSQPRKRSDIDDDNIRDGVHPKSVAVEAVAAATTTPTSLIQEDPLATTNLPHWQTELHSIAYEKLELASSYLTMLGIPLVVEAEAIDDDNVDNKPEERQELFKGDGDKRDYRKKSIDDDDGDNQSESTTSSTSAGLLDRVHQASKSKPKKKQFIKRSDQDVVVDILRTIKELVRIKYEYDGRVNIKKSLNENDKGFNNNAKNATYCYYYPFMGESMVPCYVPLPNSSTKSSLAPSSDINIDPHISSPPNGCNEQQENQQQQHPPPHPAIQGFKLVLLSLCYMDAYCPHLQAHQDQMKPEDEDEDEDKNNRGNKIWVGMKDRHHMVNQLMDSLQGEICDAWPFQDRSSRIQWVALHYQSIPSSPSTRSNNQTKEQDEIANTIVDNVSPQTQSRDMQNTKIRPLFGETTKSHQRLATLAERCFLAKLVVSVYLFRQDREKALELIWTYVVATAPALALEDYPKLPPVQSLCVLEAMLSASAPRTSIGASTRESVGQGEDNKLSPNHFYSWVRSAISQTIASAAATSWILQIISLTVSTTASILHRRQSSADNRISDMAQVELATISRFFSPLLIDRSDARLNDESTANMAPSPITKSGILSLEDCTKVVSGRLEDLISQIDREDNCASVLSGVDMSPTRMRILTLLLVLQGDKLQIESIFGSSISKVLGSPPYDSRKNVTATSCTNSAHKPLFKIVACVNATRELEIRSLDLYRELCQASTIAKNTDISSLAPVIRFSSDESCWSRFARSITSMTHSAAESCEGVEDTGAMISVMLICSQRLADGDSVSKVIDWTHKAVSASRVAPANTPSRIFDIHDVIDHIMSQTTTVHVINLERRKDRMATFIAGCMKEQLLCRKAVIDLRQVSSCTISAAVLRQSLRPPGVFAVDGGRGSLSKVENYLSEFVGGQAQLKEFVESHWRPNDLKAFDNEAPDSEDVVVRMSSSEKACAISHILSWHGAEQSLQAAAAASSIFGRHATMIGKSSDFKACFFQRW